MSRQRRAVCWRELKRSHICSAHNGRCVDGSVRFCVKVFLGPERSEKCFILHRRFRGRWRRGGFAEEWQAGRRRCGLTQQQTPGKVKGYFGLEERMRRGPFPFHITTLLGRFGTISEDTERAGHSDTREGLLERHGQYTMFCC